MTQLSSGALGEWASETPYQALLQRLIRRFGPRRTGPNIWSRRWPPQRPNHDRRDVVPPPLGVKVAERVGIRIDVRIRHRLPTRFRVQPAAALSESYPSITSVSWMVTGLRGTPAKAVRMEAMTSSGSSGIAAPLPPNDRNLPAATKDCLFSKRPTSRLRCIAWLSDFLIRVRSLIQPFSDRSVRVCEFHDQY
jgi:hypothetical protein